MISHSITQLSKTARSSKFSHRTKATQLVAGTLGNIVMACSCPAMLAANPFFTPFDERFVEEKGVKESDYLSALINHNSLTGRVPLATPNDTNFIFAMNAGNKHGINKSKGRKEPQGAGATQMQPLMDLPLWPMSRAQIAEIIRKLNLGLSEDTITTLLNNVPEMPPGDNLTIAGMIEQVKTSLQINFDQNQNAILETLSYIQGTETPVNPSNSEHQQRLACLLLAYYAAINTSTASPHNAHAFFTSFLLHAADMAGMSGFLHHLHIAQLLGRDKPVKDKVFLKENVAISSLVFSGLKILETERIKFLQLVLDPSESEQVSISVDAILRETAKLLNDGIDRNGMSSHKRQLKSSERMLELIEEYGEDKPELIAWNYHFLNLVNVVCLILNPFAPECECPNVTIENIEDYFRESGKSTTFYSGRDKRRDLLEELKKVSMDMMLDQKNQDVKSFKKLFLYIKIYLAQQLNLNFTDENDCDTLVETLAIGFRALLEQSYDLLALLPDKAIGSNDTEQVDEVMHDKAAKEHEGTEPGEEEKRKRNQKKRIKYLKKLVGWLEYYFGSSEMVPDPTDSSESEKSDTDSSDFDSSDFDNNPDWTDSDWIDSDGSDVDTPKLQLSK
ncbi:hypothetical protein [Endozoicomonas sp. 8E]|uniref:hypothetical protein n=1 Tax=Endozoicomonas sp. 8E TaxID=3035692 RepID=UPI00293945A6|nr:hypothetical protein [Endozoicomonas sp. 8E]WOG30325.1 hypothetical protein P6910_11975 [Endozoicomonas sp. 8E]